ncbi:hypothetical protein FRB90_000013 [Tulasnella sp. 427]|nr:hypothetical protein FRB90_000013 [Tulasnella sp. 427]
MSMYDQPVSFADILTNDDEETDLHRQPHQQGAAAEPSGDPQDPNADEPELQTFFVRALYDYQSIDASSLSFRRGDLIEVLTRLESGWWDGLLGEERGWFPSNYVQVVSDEEVEAELTAREAEAAVANPAAGGHTSLPAQHPATVEHQDGHAWHEDRAQQPETRNSAGRADDYWLPSVTASGQVYFVNTRTGEQSSELPQNDHLARGAEFTAPPPIRTSHPTQQVAQQDTRAPLVRSRSDTYATTATGTSTSALTASSISTPANSAFVGSGVPKEEEVPAPWVKRLVDGGAYCWMNQETGHVRWSAPSPVLAPRKETGRLPTLMDTDESDWSAQEPYPSSRGLSDVGLPASIPKDMQRLSVYSDDSEVRPFDPASPSAPPIQPHPAQDQSTSSGSRTDRTSQDQDADNVSQPTSAASAQHHDAPSGESLARQLQALLQPPSADSVEMLSNRAREAILAVVEAVGRQVATPVQPGQPTDMSLRVAAVVTAVRNLLYVSGTLNAPIANIHLSRQYASSPNSTSYVEEALHESGRAPLLELKPYQRKVTATLSKLVLSARAADSNPDWPYDDATTRVDSDASELERAVVSFVMEVTRMEIMGSVVLVEKRLEGVLVSGDGLAGVGTAIYGAGLGGEWKGMGFIPVSEGSGSAGDASGFPQWNLGSEPLNEMRGMMKVVEEGLSTVLDGPSITVEVVIPRLRHVLSHLSAFLAIAEDIDVARTVDVDGIIYSSPEPALADTYNGLVQTARKLMRKLECDKQAIYDEGSNVWSLGQAIFVERTAMDAVTLVKLRLEFLKTWDNPADGLKCTAEVLTSAMVDTVDDYQKLYEVAQKQEDAHRHGIRASIGHRDGQTSPVNRHRLSLAAGPRHDRNLIQSADEITANLDFNLDDVIDEDEDVVDVSFALGNQSKTKPSAAAQYAHAGQLHAPIDPSTGRAASPARGRGPSLDIRHRQSGSISTATATAWERETDGDGTSTIRPSMDGRHVEEDDEDDLDLDLHPHIRKPPKVKAPARAAKIEQMLGREAPAHYVATQTAQQQVWYLRPDSEEGSILVNPDGGVRGGTLPALIERLTLHNYRDAVYNDTFLITFKSFTTVDELFDLLVARFNIPEPAGLKPDELKQWVEKKQTPIRFRVINILKMLMEGSVLEKEDMHILGRIREFATEAAKVAAPAQQLIALVNRAENGEFGRVTKVTTMTQPPAAIIPKSSRALKLMDVDPIEMARQLTIMESRMFMKIRPMECLSRAKEGSSEDDNIRKIINMSNKIASWVAEQVLSKDDARRRAAYIKQFIMIAERCREMNNFSSMAALLAGLNSPPIRRLKRTWEQLNARFTSQLDDVEKTLDSGRNFMGYRQLLATVAPPCIPFLGVYLTTLTFIQDGNKDMLNKETNIINFGKRQKAAEVIREIKTYQSRPYNLTELPNVQDLIEKSLARVENSPDFWELSMQLEPREREDEKMARLLQESGFL